jgi:hypothetical protein
MFVEEEIRRVIRDEIQNFMFYEKLGSTGPTGPTCTQPWLSNLTNLYNTTGNIG